MEEQRRFTHEQFERLVGASIKKTVVMFAAGDGIWRRCDDGMWERYEAS